MPHFLIAESETPAERAARRASAGNSSGETYAVTLRELAPGCAITIIAPADEEPDPLSAEDVRGYDAVFVAGSPLHVYENRPEVARQIAFMRAVFASGTPSFGSCAGLQVAVAAAGGAVRKMPARMEAGIGRHISATDAGRDHPLLAGRPSSWDAPSVHGDEVETLPPGAVLLAGNAVTRVQAVEIRHDLGIFWGVQYHPELAPGEIATALERQSDALVEAGLAQTREDVATLSGLLAALQDDPDQPSLRWLLGVDAEFADPHRRRTELRNFLAHAPFLKASASAPAATDMPNPEMLDPEGTDMATTLTASFDTRREAEMTIERLVQEYAIERTDIFVAAEGDENSAGDETAGSDTQAGTPTPEARSDAALHGRIALSVDIEDGEKADAVRAAFAEFDAEAVSER